MKILITGTSGSGKSAVGKELKKRGFDVIDTDQDVFTDLSIAYWISKKTGKGVDMPWPPPKNWHNENDWIWRTEVLKQRLDSSNSPIVFAYGDSRNKHEAYSLFDKVFVLSTNDYVLRRRIQSRTDNYFGKSDAEFAWVLDQNRIIAEEVSQAGGALVDASQSIDKVVEELLVKARQ